MVTEKSVLQNNKPTPEMRGSTKTSMCGGGVKTTAWSRA